MVILSSSISSGSHKTLSNSSGFYTGLSTPVMCVRGQWIQCMKKSLKILEQECRQKEGDYYINVMSMPFILDALESVLPQLICLNDQDW